jgi:hypothetical protein
MFEVLSLNYELYLDKFFPEVFSSKGSSQAMNYPFFGNFYQFNSVVKQVIDQLPEELVENLSDDELIDLQETIIRHRKGLDIRLSLPFLPKQLRMMLLASLDPNMARIANHLSEELVENLSDDEIADLQELIVKYGQGLDIRHSLSFLPKQLQPILLATLDHPNYIAHSKQVWTPRTTAIAISLGLVALLTGYVVTNPTIQGKLIEDPNTTSGVHPTVLPWIESEAACQGEKQSWKNGFCYDSEHSPEF